MRLTLASFLLAIVTVLPGGKPLQRAVFFSQNKASSGSCTPPTMTYRWAAYNSLNTCGTGVACTNGAAGRVSADLVSSNNATNTTGSNQPTYTTGAINGQPAWTFNGSTPNFFSFTTALPFQSWTTITIYAVVENTGTSGQFLATSAHNTHLLGYGFNGSGNQAFGDVGIASLASGTAVYSTSTWYTIVMQYNTSTLAYTLYKCSGGTCAADGSGTASSGFSFTSATDAMGADVNDGGAYNFSGNVAEIGVLNGTSTAGIGAWSQCEYGI
jgi:hypothetical protein